MPTIPRPSLERKTLPNVAPTSRDPRLRGDDGSAAHRPAPPRHALRPHSLHLTESRASPSG